jgi:hypothetical protein
MTSNQRSIASRQQLAAASPGFAGPGHTAVEVIAPDDLVASDPFVLLMDDRLDFKPGSAIGGAHPHAGLETVTFMLDGSLEDRDEGPMRAGDAVWMTAGRGVIHNEDVHAGGPSRLLQLWITLPEHARGAEPRLQRLQADELPVFRAPGVEARLYSGSTNGLVSATRNHVPVTLVDVRLAAGASFEQELSASYNGFLLPLRGAIRVGDQTLADGEIGWLDRRDGSAPTTLHIDADGDARVLLYAGERQNEPTVQQGPFVAGSRAAITTMYQQFRAGRFPRLSQLAR